jgi:hypothetical protein
MATGTKCRVFRPGEDAAANQHESVGRKNEANAGGRTEFRRALDVTHPRLRVNGSTPGSLARVKPGAGYPVLYVGLF